MQADIVDETKGGGRWNTLEKKSRSCEGDGMDEVGLGVMM
jgi:hypothetical protein